MSWSILSARQESLKIKEAIETIPRWESYTFTHEGDVAIKINDVSIDENWNTLIRLESENIWKEPAFFSFWTYNTYLITEDWYKVGASSIEQVVSSERPEWYDWCIRCSSNPWKKNVEDVYFETIWWKYLVLTDSSKRLEIKFEL